MNLVLNARDAMPQGGRVTIETRSVQLGPGAGTWRSEEERAMSGRFTMLSVTDTGHGMDAATLQRIWEPFFTTKPPGQGHRARARVGLRSRQAERRLRLGRLGAGPRDHRAGLLARDPRRGRAARRSRSARRRSREGARRCCVVEDEDLVRALAVRALRSFGYTCLQARDAGEALRLLDDAGDARWTW